MNELILNILQNVTVEAMVQIIVPLVPVLAAVAWKMIRADRGRHSVRAAAPYRGAADV